MNAAGTASLLQRFFTDRLREQQGVSAHTVASYRDTFRLLLRFAAQQLKRGALRIAHGRPRRSFPGDVPSPPRTGARQLSDNLISAP
jgi:site-specific recombinase XerC